MLTALLGFAGGVALTVIAVALWTCRQSVPDVPEVGNHCPYCGTPRRKQVVDSRTLSRLLKVQRRMHERGDGVVRHG